MSIKVMTYIWDHSPHTGSDLLMLLAIADHANDEGVACPNLMTLAQKCRVLKRQAIRIIQHLEQAGSLSISHGSGRGHPSIYTIKGVIQDTLCTERVSSRTPFAEIKGVIQDTLCTERVSSRTPFAEIKGVIQDTLCTGIQGTSLLSLEDPDPDLQEGDPDLQTKDRDKEKPGKKTLARNRHVERDYSQGFHDFWDAYPATRKRGKTEAWRIWQHDHLDARAAEITEKVHALIRYDPAFQEGFEPEPHRWLKRQRYNDDLLTEPRASPFTRTQQRDDANIRATLDLEEYVNGTIGRPHLRPEPGPVGHGVQRRIGPGEETSLLDSSLRHAP